MKPISESTKKAYTTAIRQLRNLTTAPVTDVKTIKDTLDATTYSDSSKNVIYCAIKALHSEELTEEQKEQYKQIIHAIIDKKRSLPSQTATETQKAKMIDWADVLALRENLKSYEDFRTHMNYVIVCLYSMFPPRRLEYCKMRIVESDPTLTVPTENLYVLNPPTFIFAEYKTFKTYGVQRFAVPADLAEVLKIFIETWNLTYVLQTTAGEPLNNHSLGTRIISIFETNVKKSVGASMLRHSFTTSLRQGEKPLRLQKEIAERMGHSVLMNQEYAFLEDD